MFLRQVEGIERVSDPQDQEADGGGAFLGMANFYHRFIQVFHQLSHLLTRSTSQVSPMVAEWTSQMLHAFHQLRDKLCSQACLCIPSNSDFFLLKTDTSSLVVGAVLSVVRDGVLRLTAFFSRQLHGAQSRYSTQELEDLGLFEAIKFFTFYLYEKKFTVLTNHVSLVSLMSVPQYNKSLLNWAMKLSDFDFVIE